jgi:altronate dehydratase
MTFLLAAVMQDIPVVGDVIEKVASWKNLGAAAGVVVIILGLDWLRRRGPDLDQQSHEETKRLLITKLADSTMKIADLAEHALRSAPQSAKPKDGSEEGSK